MRKKHIELNKIRKHTKPPRLKYSYPTHNLELLPHDCIFECLNIDNDRSRRIGSLLLQIDVHNGMKILDNHKYLDLIYHSLVILDLHSIVS